MAVNQVALNSQNILHYVIVSLAEQLQEPQDQYDKFIVNFEVCKTVAVIHKLAGSAFLLERLGGVYFVY